MTKVTFKNNSGTPTKIVYYAYDAFDRLVRRQLDPTGQNTTIKTTWLAYDGNQIMLDLDNFSPTLGIPAMAPQRYLWGPGTDMLLASEKQRTTGAGPADWAVTDYEGSIDFVLERGYTGGITVASDAYSDFGQQTNTSGGVKPNPIFRYTGRYLDPDTGLQWNGGQSDDLGNPDRGRWYNPSLGRWMGQDPIGFDGDSSNLYRYVNNSPTNFTDPTGEAYFAKRPLRGWPWLGPLSSNPVDDKKNTELCHEQLFFEDSKHPSNVGFFGDNSLHVEENPIGYRITDPTHYDDGLMRQAVKNVVPPPYNASSCNCQHYADMLRAEYDRLKRQQPNWGNPRHGPIFVP